MKPRIAALLTLGIGLGCASPVHAESAEPSATKPLNPLLLPVLAPPSLIAPGISHLLRGEKQTGKALLRNAGITWGAFLLTASGVALSGASDVVMYPAIPILVLSGSYLMASGTGDLIGSFTNGTLAGSPALFLNTEPAFADSLVSAGYRSIPTDDPGEHHFLSVSASSWLDRFQLRGQTSADINGRAQAYGAGGSFWIAPPSVATMPGLRQGWFADLDLFHENYKLYNHQLWRANGQIRFTIWGGEFAPSLQTLTASFWAGFYQEWVNYLTQAPTDTDEETGATGGFQLRWIAAERFRPSWGYEHARTGIVGGVTQGYLGIFNAGFDFGISGNDWVTTRIDFGSPVTYQIRWERRWL